MITRDIAQKCIQLSKQFPVLTITGPRQSGKTTLARLLFPDKPYVNLEDPHNRRLAIDDARRFLGQYPQGAIFDEIQRAPDIASYIQTIVDERDIPGMFILTGSQQFEISNTVNQSLAGRTALVRLLPLSLKEIFSSDSKGLSLEKMIFQGGYPRLYNKKIAPYDYYRNYFETYVERDIRQLSHINDLHLFDKFVRMLASRVGQLLNASSLANDIGVSSVTMRSWISLLEASYIVFLLQPYHANIGKRLMKSPKIYFYDTGLVSYLLDIEKHEQLRTHALRGHLFENLVIVEFLKGRYNKAQSSNLFFYRDHTGNEVDLVLREALSLIPVEIKSAETYSSDYLKGLNHFNKVFKQNLNSGYVVYGGEPHLPTFRSWKELP
jgi:predicted AAA+ superfamily ATPase